ncbi:class I SAM-dependent methyltransferase [Roseateles amylovorans]|uniref:Class I SAM-dependent methyltransferase n=1 Tax=Roseateles amylovorans TaxID=2978473 RepID=A0ABY6AUV2_9BURK|nr:class I SAM-dependent methyltransferase [Roseateles amylovorans]UXH76996.1 class I SAM-dependent methyltransferase [Roseateles amylovorans]
MTRASQDDDPAPIVEAPPANGLASAELSRWLGTPPGRYLLDWEQRFIDEAVVDLFGFHAVQLGLPQLNGLRANRMPQRWLALEHVPHSVAATGLDASATAAQDLAAGRAVDPSSARASRPLNALDTQPEPRTAFADPPRAAVYCEFDALPFPASSLDLVVLPHTLELAADPHRCLREVERVLRPEGRVVILGLNPASLWAVRQNLARVNGRLMGRAPRLYLPEEGEYIGYWRLRDWLRLLSFEVERAKFGCYRPPLLSEVWLDRWHWLERPGSKWWTVLGALYGVVAIKRVHGMRLVGLARKRARGAKAAPAVAIHQQSHRRGPD